MGIPNMPSAFFQLLEAIYSYLYFFALWPPLVGFESGTIYSAVLTRPSVIHFLDLEIFL